MAQPRIGFPLWLQQHPSLTKEWSCVKLPDSSKGERISRRKGYNVIRVHKTQCHKNAAAARVIEPLTTVGHTLCASSKDASSERHRFHLMHVDSRYFESG